MLSLSPFLNSFGSALTQGCSNVNFKVVKKCLESNCDPNEVDSEGKNPFHVIFCNFSKDVESAKKISDALIEFGCTPNSLNKLC